MPLAVLLALIVCCVSLAGADDIGLIRVAESWRYYKGVQEPPADWMQPAFSDRTWPEAMTGFSTPGGYGEATIFTDYGTSYTSVYFRKRFAVENPETIRQLVLRLDFDDGCVIYLNGREVARWGVSGAPGTVVPAGSRSFTHPRGYTELIDLSSGLDALQTGENLLAIHILGSGPGDWSMAFVPELLANFIRTPLIQNTTVDSTEIAWKTLSLTDGLIQYGAGASDPVTENVSFGQTNHLAQLRNLQSDTAYRYRIGARFPNGETWSDWSTFRTFKSSGPISFNIVGDTGWGSIQQYQVAASMSRHEADLTMHLGDLAYPSFTERNADLRVLSVYAPQLRSSPLFAALGNHDVVTTRAGALDLLHLPTNNVTGTEHYYSFDHGDAHFVVLWSDLTAQSTYDPGSPQYAWLERDLAASPKPWKFIFFHHCWRTSSLHRTDDYDFNGIPDSVRLDAIAELASRRGVQAIIHGHDHCYERFTPNRGVLSFISGGGGAALYGISTPHWDSVEYQPRHHFLQVRIEGEIAAVHAIDEKGILFDTYHIPRGFPPDRLHEAAWHKPAVESTPPTDSDGNIAGQAFDFAGPPIHPKLGRSTSTGRLFVNNDAQFLYLGLDEVLLHSLEEVHLFIEPPKPGPPVDLRQLGYDLRFTLFAPSVVAILGDEFADLPQPPWIDAAPRQGLRFLRETLPFVSDQRVQQFNHSPQNGPVIHEQNANFIEMAMPLSEIGAAPGDVIRIAAAVALAPASTPATPAAPRSFDTGGILHPDGLSARPVEVRLAAQPPADSDGDAMPDDSERRAGTDPNDPLSNLRLAAQVLGDCSVRLVWNASPGHWYRLEYASEAGGNFRDLTPAFPRRAAGVTEQFVLPAGIRPSLEYYRVVLVSE